MSNQKSAIVAAKRLPIGARRSSLGLTLVELVVCVSLLAVLIGLAIPSFSTLLSDWRRDSAIHDFMGDLQLARSTALRTSRAAVMCVTQDGVGCDLGVHTNDWRQGWMVFSDLNGDGARALNEPVIVRRGPLLGMQLMQSSTAIGRIALRSNGLLSTGTGTVTVLSNSSGKQVPTGIRINATGRAYRLQLPES